MGFYEKQVLPRFINVACGSKPMRPLRQRACAGLAGEVLEVGFGSGLNIPYYPAAVTRVTAVEPSDVGWKLASSRRAKSNVPVERSGLDGQSLPFADDTFDMALSTWTMCTIPDAVAALREIRRVLKPGGTIHFVEHGLAPDEKVQRTQHRMEGFQNRVAGGCSIIKPIPDLFTSAGFTVTDLDVFYMPGPKFASAMSVGVASG